MSDDVYRVLSVDEMDGYDRAARDPEGGHYCVDRIRDDFGADDVGRLLVTAKALRAQLAEAEDGWHAERESRKASEQAAGAALDEAEVREERLREAVEALLPLVGRMDNEGAVAAASARDRLHAILDAPRDGTALREAIERATADLAEGHRERMNDLARENATLAATLARVREALTVEGERFERRRVEAAQGEPVNWYYELTKVFRAWRASVLDGVDVPCGKHSKQGNDPCTLPIGHEGQHYAGPPTPDGQWVSEGDLRDLLFRAWTAGLAQRRKGHAPSGDVWAAVDRILAERKAGG